MAFFEKRNHIPASQATPELSFVEFISRYTSEAIQQSPLNALKNADVWTAVDTIASDIASTQINVHENGIVNKDNKISYLLNVKPNELLNAREFKFIIVANMLLTGQSLVEIKRNKEGNPISLEFLQFEQLNMSIDHVKQEIEYQVTDKDGNTKIVPRQNILHFKAFTLDGLKAYSPLYALAYELETSSTSKATLKDFIERGNKATGILKLNQANLSPDAKRVAKEQFDKALGENKTISTVIIDENQDYKPITVPTEILKYINDNSNATTNKIAQIFKLPLSKFGMELVNTSTQQENLAYVQNTLSHYFNIIVSELTNKLFNDVEKLTSEFTFDTTKFLTLTPQEQMTFLKEGVQSSLITINEARKQLGYNPVDNGDELIANMSFTPISKLGEQPPTGEPPTE